MARWIQLFDEGDASQRALLGGKGANLAEMARLGLPIPPGFTITTDACRAYLERRRHGARGTLGRGRGRTSARSSGRSVAASVTRPPRCSSRSAPGRPLSMPGMMETILNLGLNDATVAGLAAQAGDERFAWDSYRRLIQMYGRVVLGVPGERFEADLAAHKRRAGRRRSMPPSTRRPCGPWSRLPRPRARASPAAPFPTIRWVQLRGAVEAVFRSWNTARAVAYRREFRIPDDLGTAVTVQAMVFGNLGDDCATGVAFTRDPATGERRLVGEYLPNAQGEDVVAGIRTPRPLDGMAADPRLAGAFAELADGRHAAGGALQRRPGSRVHDRAGAALDAPDPGGQTHRLRRGPHRGRDGGRGTDRPGHRGPSRATRPARPVAPSDDRSGRRPRWC